MIAFEDGMKRLSEIVAALEQNELPLAEAVALYEEGVKLSGACGETLRDAKLKVTKETGEELAI